jgi:hypothetical protein
MKERASKYYYVFIGQNATTGQPHPITGRSNIYGSFIAFKHKADAKRYVNEFYSGNYSEFAVAGTFNTLRKYKQGLSWYEYITYLLMLDYLVYDDSGDLI